MPKKCNDSFICKKIHRSKQSDIQRVVYFLSPFFTQVYVSPKWLFFEIFIFLLHKKNKNTSKFPHQNPIAK